jgi:hypothetical protein
MRHLRKTVLALTVAAASGCASPGKLAELDQRFEAGWRPTKSYCLFGGETPQINAYCSRQQFGEEGYLMAINQQATASLPPEADCKDHARTVIALLQREAELRTQRIYSCPEGAGAGQACHVSVLVTNAKGGQWVLDNGAVVSSTVGVAGVVAFNGFSSEVDGTYWVDRPPNIMQAMFPDLDIALPAR